MEVKPDTLQKTALDYGKLVVQGPKLGSNLVWQTACYLYQAQ